MVHRIGTNEKEILNTCTATRGANFDFDHAGYYPWKLCLYLTSLAVQPHK